MMQYVRYGFLLSILFAFTLSAHAQTGRSTASLIPSDPALAGSFGASVSVDGDRALVSAASSGAVYVYVRTANAWTEEAILTPGDSPGHAGFGASVSLEGDRALIGAPSYDGGGHVNSGAAYVFVRTEDGWLEEDILTPVDPQLGAEFGRSVSLNGGRALIGAPRRVTGGLDAGAAYLFAQSGSSWIHEQTLTADVPRGAAEFGSAVFLDGDRALVGAPGEDNSVTFAASVGAAYIFSQAEGTWTHETQLRPPQMNGNERFGLSVALDGDRALVGALNRSLSYDEIGEAYIFTRGESSWTREKTLVPSITGSSAYTRFGQSVALEGDYALVGAPGGPGSDNPGFVEVFSREDGMWTRGVKLEASGDDAGSQLGVAVSLDGDYAFVGDDINSVAYAFPAAPYVEVDPGALAFGKVAVGAPNERTLSVTNTSTFKPASFTISISDDAFSVSSDSYTLEPGATEEIPVTVTPDVLGSYSANITLTPSDSGSPIAIPATATGVDTKVAFSSNMLSFPDALPGSHAMVPFKVFNLGTEDLTVTDVSVVEGPFWTTEITFVVPAGGSYDLSAVFGPNEAGPFESELIFTHDQASSPDTVFVEGFASGAEIEVDAPGIVFPSTEVYQTNNSGMLQISNPGTHTLKVNDIKAYDATGKVQVRTFSGSPDELEVEPGTFQLVTVEFTPDTLGTIEGWLAIEHNGPDSPMLVRVSGEGTMPGVRFRPFAETAEISAPSFVTVAFLATDPSGRGLPFLGETAFYDVADNTEDGTLDVDQNPEAMLSVEGFGTVPFSIKTVLMLDNSFSIGNDLDAVKEAARVFVAGLLPQQQVAIYSFSESIQLLQDFTSDVEALDAAIDGITLGPNSTNLYGAAIEGVSAWEDIFKVTGTDQRFELGTMVLFSDGQDTQGSSTKSEALAAIGDKEVVTVAVGADVGSALGELHSASFVSPIVVSDFDELSGAFESVQEELVRLSNSLYWLTYASPRRGDAERQFTVSLKDNSYSGEGSAFTVFYNSAGFESLTPGVYVNRSVQALAGVDEVTVAGESDLILTAETLLGLDAPHYTWSVADASVLTLRTLNESGSEVKISKTNSAGTSTTVTVTDEANGHSTTVTINVATTVSADKEAEPIAGFTLQHNYPNPFSAQTTLTYTVGAPEHVRLSVYDILGRRVATLVDTHQTPGSYTVTIDGGKLAAGMYFVRMEAGSFTELRRITRVR